MIPKPFFEFFKIFSDRHLAKNPKMKYLPTEIRMLILSYLRKPRNFYIQDMGSIHGTYIKMKQNQFRKLCKGQTYQIGGTEIYLNILEVILPSRKNKINDEKTEDDMETLFMKYLGREFSNGIQIHGLPKESYMHYNKSKSTEFERVKVPYPYSTIKFEIMPQGGFNPQTHLLISKVPPSQGLIKNFNNFKNEFVIGRQDGLNDGFCDISLNQSIISREQCRIKFHKSDTKNSTGYHVWEISDGSKHKPSTNGTFFCLTDFRFRNLKQPSSLHPLIDFEEYKYNNQNPYYSKST